MNESNPPSWGLVLIRIAVGGILMVAGWMKISNGVGEELVLGTKQAFADAPGIVRAIGENIVLPHPWFFAKLIQWGELLAGTALFLGAFTRPAGLAMSLQFLLFYFAGPESMRTLILMMGVASFGCAISRAGRRAGADVFLDERCPGWMTWARK